MLHEWITIRKYLNYTIISWVMTVCNNSSISSFASKSHGLQRAHIFMFPRWASAVGCFFTLCSLAFQVQLLCISRWLSQTTLFSLLFHFHCSWPSRPVSWLKESHQWAKHGRQKKMMGGRSADGRSEHCPYTPMLDHGQCHLWSWQHPAREHTGAPWFLINEVHICQAGIRGSSGSLFLLSCFVPIITSVPTLATLRPTYPGRCREQRRFPKPSSLTPQFESKPVPLSISSRAFVSMSSAALSIF